MARKPDVRLALRWLSIAALVSTAAFSAPAQLKDGLTVASPSDVGLHGAPLDALTAAVVAAEFPDTTSVLVFKDDRLVSERYFGGGGINALNDTRSATKTLTAMIVGQAIADGALRSADQPVFELLPDLAPFRNDGPLKRGVTLMDLLTMSSALDCNDFDEHNVGNEENMYPQSNWARWAVDLPVKQDYARNRAGRGPFSYCTGGTFLLGQVVQRATGKSLDRYFDSRLLHPLGIVERQWSRSPSGEFMTGGGLRLRSRDLVKIGAVLTANGNWHGRQLLPAAWVRKMQSLTNIVNEEQSYGMLYWQRQYQSACGLVGGWYMSGNGGNAIVSVPSKSMVVVVTRAHYNQRGMHEQTVKLLERYVFAALSCS